MYKKQNQHNSMFKGATKLKTKIRENATNILNCCFSQ